MTPLQVLVPVIGLISGVYGWADETSTIYTTVVTTAYETYCPYPTTFAYKNVTYTATTATTITITNCPCTVTHKKPPPYTTTTTYCPPPPPSTTPCTTTSSYHHHPTKTYITVVTPPPETIIHGTTPIHSKPKTPIKPTSTTPAVVITNAAVQEIGSSVGGLAIAAMVFLFI